MGTLIINFRRHFDRKTDAASKPLDELAESGIAAARKTGFELPHKVDYIFTSPSYRAVQAGYFLGQGNYEKHKHLAKIESDPALRELGISEETLEKARAVGSAGGSSQGKLDMLVNHLLLASNIPAGQENCQTAGERLIHFIGDIYFNVYHQRNINLEKDTTHVEAISHSPVLEAGMLGLINSNGRKTTVNSVDYIGGAYTSGIGFVVKINSDPKSFGTRLDAASRTMTHELNLKTDVTKVIRERAGLYR